MGLTAMELLGLRCRVCVGEPGIHCRTRSFLTVGLRKASSMHINGKPLNILVCRPRSETLCVFMGLRSQNPCLPGVSLDLGVGNWDRSCCSGTKRPPNVMLMRRGQQGAKTQIGLAHSAGILSAHTATCWDARSLPSD